MYKFIKVFNIISFFLIMCFSVIIFITDEAENEKVYISVNEKSPPDNQKHKDWMVGKWLGEIKTNGSIKRKWLVSRKLEGTYEVTFVKFDDNKESERAFEKGR